MGATVNPARSSQNAWCAAASIADVRVIAGRAADDAGCVDGGCSTRWDAIFEPPSGTRNVRAIDEWPPSGRALRPVSQTGLVPDSDRDHALAGTRQSYRFAYRGTQSVACTSPIVAAPVSNRMASGDPAGASVPW